MAKRMKEQTGWCTECNARRLVRRRDTFFQQYRCTVCGAIAAAVGDKFTAEASQIARAGSFAVQGESVPRFSHAMQMVIGGTVLILLLVLVNVAVRVL